MSTTVSGSTAMVCPRGHQLTEESVYCHVCWVRLEPVDPESIKRVRSRRWSPLLVTASVLAGVALGGAVASFTTLGGSNPFTSTSGAVVAAEPVTAEPVAAEPVAAEPVAAEPVAAEPVAVAAEPEPVAVAAQPLAATIIVPVTVCVPATTATVQLRSPGASAGEARIAAQTALAGQGACSAGEVEATVTPDEPIADGTVLKVVARNADGERVARVIVTTPGG